MIKHVFLALFLTCAKLSFAQQLAEYNSQRNKTDEKLMLGLGGWATSNFIVSGIGWATVPDGEAHYFHQMNVMWNTVNLGLAIPGYIKARKANSSMSFAETIKAQQKTEKIFLINTGLDVGYMAGGLLLRSEARSNPKKQDKFNGYGNSLLLQGGFLFAFDLTAYIIHQRHAKKSLDPLMNSIEMSSNGLGIKWNISNEWVKRDNIFL